MNQLLSANLFRLRKSKLFWGLLALMLAYALYLVIRRRLLLPDFEQEALLFNHAEYIVWFMAVIVPFFLGTEHTDNTIRRKILGGHTRLSIYLAHLTTVILVSFCFCAAYMLPVWGLGSVLLVPPSSSSQGEIAYIMLAILAMSMAFCAFYTAVVLNYSNKAGALVVCVLTAFVLRLVMGRLFSWLHNHPEFLHDGSPNPQYPGVWHSFGQCVLDFLPSGQAERLSRATGYPAEAMRLERLPLLSLLFTAVSTAIGSVLFQRKDLK